MKHTRFLSLFFLALFATLSRADRIGGFIYIPPVSIRVIQAEVVLAGKVTGVDEKTVTATLDKANPQKVEYRVFTLKIEQGIKGTKGLTHLKVAIPTPLAQPVLPRPRPGPMGPITLEKGQEVLMFLQLHHSESFLVPATLQPIVDKRTPTYKNDLEMTVKLGKLLDDPSVGLKSKDDEERYLTAALLVTKYRTPPAGAYKEAELTAEESKSIMQGLLAGKWDVQTGRADGFAPMQVFMMLNPQQAGWVPPKDFQLQGASMKKWLSDNVEKVRIKRFVLSTEEKK